jgi:hypothetical protein
MTLVAFMEDQQRRQRRDEELDRMLNPKTAVTVVYQTWGDGGVTWEKTVTYYV